VGRIARVSKEKERERERRRRRRRRGGERGREKG
jgi:hypothetical protein